MKPIKEVENGDYNESQRKITKTYLMILVLCLLISLFGGSLLGWWLHKYHSTNKQLWMVPFSLILFLTPLIIWFSLFISQLCISKSYEELEDASNMSQLIQIHPKR
jgi:H+/Cl- antiporter ClcA